MNLTFEPLLSRSLDELAEVLNRAFTDYIMPANFRSELLGVMLRTDSIDLAASRIVLREGETAGIALIARRGDCCRLAAMGIAPEARGQGVGHRFMERLLDEAKERGEQAMNLEVIEQNTAAVRLYERVGFTRVRRLVGFAADPASGVPDSDLKQVSLALAAAEVLRYGWPDLPWQISGETLAQYTQPAVAYALGPAFVVLSGPERPTLTIQAIVVDPAHRRQGHATRLLRALQAEFPTKSWRVSIVFPEEFAVGLFEPLGFRRENLSQFQMIQYLRSA